MELLSYFKTHYGVNTLGDVRWSHAVNSQGRLGRLLANPKIMIIESDLSLSTDGQIIAAHPPVSSSDLTFNELLKQISSSKKGLKIDFKNPTIIQECLLAVSRANLKQPVILNADILTGNSATPSKFNPYEFINTCQRYYCRGVLSLGCTTIPDPQFPYNREQVNQMLELCQGLEQVTFPVRACLLPTSWQELTRLLIYSNYSFTVWNNEPVDNALLNWIRTNTNPQRTFYDLIDGNKESIKLI